MSSVSRKQLESWLKTIDVTGRVLDVGGSQNPIKGRTKSWEVEDYKILDLVYPHEQKQRPDIIEDIQRVSWIEDDFGESYFDTVFCIEVMEYVFDPLSALRNINKFLCVGGRLYISLHFLYGLHNPKGEDCLRYSKNAIKKLLSASGFTLEQMIDKKVTDPGMVSLEEFYRREGMRLDFDDMETYIEGCFVIAHKVNNL